jgi:hypothetical protein
VRQLDGTTSAPRTRPSPRRGPTRVGRLGADESQPCSTPCWQRGRAEHVPSTGNSNVMARFTLQCFEDERPALEADDPATARHTLNQGYGHSDSTSRSTGPARPSNTTGNAERPHRRQRARQPARAARQSGSSGRTRHFSSTGRRTSIASDAAAPRTYQRASLRNSGRAPNGISGTESRAARRGVWGQAGASSDSTCVAFLRR